MKKFLAFVAAAFFASAAYGQNAGPVANHAFAIGKGPNVSGYTSLLCGAGQLAVAQASADPICRTVSGDWTLNAAGVSTLATVNANVGTFGSATQAPQITLDAKGRATAASNVTITPALASVTGFGTGVGAALAVNVGAAGAPVLFNGAGGTPSAITLTNGTGLPVAGVSGMGAGCNTFLATPSSANLRGCVTDESGTGLAYFQGGDIGTPSAGVGTNLTALNATNLASGTVAVARGGVDQTAWTTYAPTFSTTTVGGTPITAVTTGNGGRFRLVGKTVFFSLDFQITNVGVGNSGQVSFTLPVTGLNVSMGIGASGKEVINTNKLLSIGVLSTTTGGIVFYDNTGAITLNNRFQLSGFYEAL